MDNLPPLNDTRQLPHHVRAALHDARAGRLPDTLRPVLARRLALAILFEDQPPGRLPADLLDLVDAELAKLKAGRWPGWRTRTRDRLVLEHLAAEDEQERTGAEILAAEHHAARYEAEADVTAPRPGSAAGPAAFLRFGDHVQQ